MFLYNMMSEIPIMSPLPPFPKCTKKNMEYINIISPLLVVFVLSFSFSPIHLQVKVPQHTHTHTPTLLSFSSVYNVYSFPKCLCFFLSKHPFLLFHTYDNVEQPIVSSQTANSYHKSTFKYLYSDIIRGCTTFFIYFQLLVYWQLHWIIFYLLVREECIFELVDLGLLLLQKEKQV